jgi:hypothetical protein
MPARGRPLGSKGGAAKRGQGRGAALSRGAEQSSFLENTGPQTVEELSAWDDFLAKQIGNSGLGETALRLLKGGALMYTDYSGLDFPREAIRMCLPAVSSYLERDTPELHYVRACDWGNMQHEVLCKQSLLLDEGRGCVFRDLNDRLHPDMQHWLNTVAPGKETPHELALEANDKIVKHLAQNSSWAFSRNATSFCSVHKCKCPAYPAQVGMTAASCAKMNAEASLTLAPGYSHAVAQPRQSLDSSSFKCSEPKIEGSSPIRVVSKAKAPPLAWYEAMDKSLDVDNDAPALLALNIGGLTCTDYSPLGKQSRGAGLQERHAAVWRQERRQLAQWLLEDVFFSENSERHRLD